MLCSPTTPSSASLRLLEEEFFTRVFSSYFTCLSKSFCNWLSDLVRFMSFSRLGMNGSWNGNYIIVYSNCWLSLLLLPLWIIMFLRCKFLNYYINQTYLWFNQLGLSQITTHNELIRKVIVTVTVLLIGAIFIGMIHCFCLYYSKLLSLIRHNMTSMI